MNVGVEWILYVSKWITALFLVFATLWLIFFESVSNSYSAKALLKQKFGMAS